jgi:DnaJ-domain-containing protein 1
MTPFENFEDESTYLTDRPVRTRGCDCPGCTQTGDFRAPKARDQLNDYYWFCIDHVREYNRQWDYFAGMSENDIETHIRKASVWDRPSWPFSGARVAEHNIREEVMREFFSDDKTETPPAPPMPKSERDALIMLELTPPVAFAAIKAQYRILVKRHHPDANGGSADSEEKFKNINQAFAVLKQLYGTDEG